MNTKEIIQLALDQGVVLYMEADKLKFKARPGGLNDQLRALIKQYRADIIAHLSAAAQSEQSSGQGKVQIAASGLDVAPLSSPQQRLWFIDQMEQGSSQFHLNMALDLKGDFDPIVAQQVLNRLVSRHQILRTVYQNREEGAVQVVLPALSVNLIQHDLTGLEADNQKARLSALLDEDVTAPFDLTKDAPIRCAYTKLGESQGKPHGVLLFNMHHIASDGWSMELLVGEFIQMYGEIVLGKPDALPQLPVQYIDYAIWQKDWLQSDGYKKQLAYWDKQLADVPQLHGLPLDNPRGQDKQYQGGTITTHLDDGLMQQLQQLARRMNMTLFMVLHSGLSLLLSRHSNSDDIVVGTMVANRRQAELERLIGFFVNVLVLRVNTDFSDVESFLNHVRQVHLDGQANQDVAFEQLVERLNIERTTAHTPLYQITLTSTGDFGTNQSSAQEQQLSDIEVTPIEPENPVAKVDINVHAKGNELVWTYDKAIFTQSHMQQLSAHLVQLLQGLAGCDSKAHPARLPMLSDAEQQNLLSELNGAASTQNPANICEQFEQTAAAYPERTALVFDEQSMSFAELNGKANQLARHLQNKGLSTGDSVGLCIDRSLNMVTAILAILKAGGVYVPVDAKLPQQRISHIIQDADIKVLITGKDLSKQLAFGLQDGQQLWLDCSQTKSSIGEYSSDNLQTLANEKAYVIYTSGTSGTPKGVLVGHQALVNFAQGFKQQLKALDLPEDSTWLWNASYAFDASLKSIACLCNGAKVVLAKEQQSRDAQALVELLAQHEIDVFNGMPLLVEQVVDILDKRDDLALNLISSGDDIAEHIWHKVAAYTAARGTRAINAYGPTETTVNASFGMISADAAINMGRPVENAKCYVLDRNRQLVPYGVSGELYVGGECLAMGYLNQPALTDESFVADPFDATSSSKLYRTGDKVKQLADGSLVYQGRIDRQVKVRGYRIELGEIESNLLKLPQVAQALVLVKANSAGHGQLVAYLVNTAKEQTFDTEQTATELAKELPEYMLPVQYVVLEQLPLTNTGKLDLAALPNPFERQAQSDEQAAPMSELEQTLCEVWAEVLKLDKIGLNDDFFKLGGDSIMSMQLVSKAKRKGLVFNVMQLFKAKTVAKLAPLVKTRKARKARPAKAVKAISGQQVLLPIAQEFFAREVDNKHHFNQSVMLEVPAGLTREMIEQLTDALYRRHDVFRLSFKPENQGGSSAWQGEYLPLMSQMVSASCHYISLDEQIVDDEQARQETILAHGEHFQRSFDLQSGGLFKAVYFDLGPSNKGRLLLLAHHLVMDGVSWRIILADLEQGYDQLKNGQAVKLAPAGSSYQQWGSFLQSYAKGEQLAGQRQYWIDSLSHEVKSLPREKMSSDEAVKATDNGAGNHDIALDKTRTRALLTTAGAVYDTEINELLLSALGLGLKNFSGNDNFRITMEGHGREMLDGADNQPDITETVGWFTCKYPLTLAVNQTDCQSVIENTKAQYRALPNKGMGYGLLKAFGEDAEFNELAAQAGSQLVFNYLGRFDQVLDKDSVISIAAEKAGQDVDEGYQVRSGLTVNALIGGGQLQLFIGYGKAQFDEVHITQLGEHLLAALELVVDHCVEIANTPEFYEPRYVQQGKALSADAIDNVVFKLNQSSSDKTVFCAPPLSGQSDCYHELATELVATANVYGLQFPDFYSQMQTRSIEQLAAFYIRLIKQVQPQGPYCILGWSAGGTIAYEIASQLKLAGDEVEMLAILDQGYLAKGAKAHLYETDPYRNIKWGYAEYIDVDWDGLLSQGQEEVLDLLVDKLIASGHKPEGLEENQIRAHFAQLVTYPMISDQCQLKACDVDIQLFQSRWSIEQDPDEPLMCWEQICSGQIEVIRAEGKHSEIVSAPNVESLAKNLTELLSKALPSQAQPSGIKES